MGCNSSKSTPVVNSISSGADDSKENSNGLLKEDNGMIKEMADEICEMGNDISHKNGALTDQLNLSQPGTAKVERAQTLGDTKDEESEKDDTEDEETYNSPKMPVKILSIAVDEDNKDKLQDNQVPVKVSFSIGDSDDEAGDEKTLKSMPEDDCLNINDGDRNECTCNDKLDSDTCVDTTCTNKIHDKYDDACCAESVKLKSENNVAADSDKDDRANRCAQYLNNDGLADTNAKADQDISGDNIVNESYVFERDICVQSVCNRDKYIDSGTVNTESSAINTTKSGCEVASTAKSDNDTIRTTFSSEDQCNKNNLGTLQSECSYQSSSDNNEESFFNMGNDQSNYHTMRCTNFANTTGTETLCTNRSTSSINKCFNQCSGCINNTNTADGYSIKALVQNTFCGQSSSDTNTLQCTYNNDYSTIQSSSCICGDQHSNMSTMCSGCSYSSSNSLDGYTTSALCAACADQSYTVDSSYSESTVRSNSFECLTNIGNKDKNCSLDIYNSGYSYGSTITSNKDGFCLICTGTICSKSAYADTMNSVYSQQYNDSTIQSGYSDYSKCMSMCSPKSSSVDSAGDVKQTVPCFKICSCLGQTLIQLQL